MRFKLFLFLCLLTTVYLKSQNSDNSTQRRDSLNRAFSQDSIKIYEPKKLTLYLALDFRNAFIGNRFLSFVGPQAGVTINYRHIVGCSYYFLNKFSPFQSDQLSTYTFEKINYISAFYQYILFDSKHFDIHIPFEIGYGKYKAMEESSKLFIQSRIAPIGAGIRFVILPHKWIGLKVGAGYSFIWEENKKIGLNGLNFSLGIKVDLRQLYLDFSYYRMQQSYRRYSKKAGI